MSEDSYEAPAVTEVAAIGAPLVGTIGSVPNPQWSEDTDVS